MHIAESPRAALLSFTALVVAGSALLWGAELFFRGTAASAIVLVAITGVALWIVRPGWCLRPKHSGSRLLLLFGVLLVSAAAAAALLAFFSVSHPYDLSTFNLAGALPAIAAITGIEELLFRHAMFRWLESRAVSQRAGVTATALAFGWAHLGPAFVGGAAAAEFYVLQASYMVWIGLVLGEIRRLSDSWPMSWLGHFSYNVTVPLFLGLVESK